MSSSNSNSYPHSQMVVSTRLTFTFSVVPTTREMVETYPRREFSRPSNGIFPRRPYDSFHGESNSHFRGFSQNGLSNDNHFGSSHGPFNSIKGPFNNNRRDLYPPLNGGVNGGIPNLTSSVITHTTSFQLSIENNSYRSPLSQGLFGLPRNEGGGSSSRSMAEPWFNGAPIRETNNMNTSYGHPLSQGFSFGLPRNGGGGNSSRSMAEPWFNGAPTRGTNNMNTSYGPPLSQSLSFGPSRYGGDGSSSRSMVEPWFNATPTRGTTNMRTTMLPPLTPNHFLTENTRYNSHPSPNGNHINIFRGPSEFTGGSNNNIGSVHSSGYGGVNRGTTYMNVPKRPRYNPLAENIPSSSSHPPPRTTNDVFAVQENDSGPSDQENIMSIDKEAEAKSWGRDLTLFH